MEQDEDQMDEMNALNDGKNITKYNYIWSKDNGQGMDENDEDMDER